jgi:hypothetical protein
MIADETNKDFADGASPGIPLLARSKGIGLTLRRENRHRFSGLPNPRGKFA